MNEEGAGLNSQAGAVTAVLSEEIKVGSLRDWRSVLSSDFIRKVMETYATRILLIGIGLVSAVIVARLLGPQGRGIYAVAAATGALGCSSVTWACTPRTSILLPATQNRSLPWPETVWR